MPFLSLFKSLSKTESKRLMAELDFASILEVFAFRFLISMSGKCESFLFFSNYASPFPI
jgi:hypothetical protein